MTSVGAVVVGAGVVGLAVARELAMRGHEVIILEAADQIGTQLSARNSEVTHAGLYYPPGSLKARCCIRGNALLSAYCRAQGIARRACGKLVVARHDQQAALARLHQNALACGVGGLRLLGAQALQQLEPWLRADAAMASDTSGIIDSHALMQALLQDAETHGALLCLGHRVTQVGVASHCFELDVACGDERFTLHCRQLVNAAGLGAVPLVQLMTGFPATQRPQQRFARGNYFSLSGASPSQRLIYPLPDAHGLGVHLTVDLAGQARFGPDVQWIDQVDYRVDTQRRAYFEAAIRRYWPDLPAHKLQPDYAGIRPKLVFGDDFYSDFLLQDASHHGIDGLVNLLGIESPGLTAAMALAEQVAASLGN